MMRPDELTFTYLLFNLYQGPGVSMDTYPPIPQVRGIDNLKHKKGSHRATYYVLRYEHNSSGLCPQ